MAEYSTKPEEKKLWTFLKVSLVCVLCFFGSAFSIMAFNNDVSTVKLFRQFYTLLTGQTSDGFTVLEFTYSLGLAVGILAFFNHLGGRPPHQRADPHRSRNAPVRGRRGHHPHQNGGTGTVCTGKNLKNVLRPKTLRTIFLPSRIK